MAYGNKSKIWGVILYRRTPRGSSGAGCFAFSSCSSAVRRRPKMKRAHGRALLTAAVVVFAAMAAAVRVDTQTPTAPQVDPANPVFDDSYVHEVRLAMN